MTAEEMAQACATAMWRDDQASQGLGMVLEHIAPGMARMRMRVTAAMVNGHGTCHGGYLFTLADSAFAFACNTANQKTVAASCSIFFLRPARLGDVLIATAEQRGVAGRSGLTDVRITDEAGTVIAEFRGNSRSIGERFFEDQP